MYLHGPFMWRTNGPQLSLSLQLASELELPAVTLSAPGVVETAGLLGLQPLRLQAGFKSSKR